MYSSHGVEGSLLIDTGAFIALLDVDDDLHEEAAAFYNSLPPTTRRSTTQAIVGECYTFFRYHVGVSAAVRWLDYLDAARAAGHLRIVYSDEDDGRSAEKLLRRFADQALSYIDSLTLVAAERYGAKAIFGFDHHLGLMGKPLLPGARTRRR